MHAKLVVPYFPQRNEGRPNDRPTGLGRTLVQFTSSWHGRIKTPPHPTPRTAKRHHSKKRALLQCIHNVPENVIKSLKIANKLEFFFPYMDKMSKLPIYLWIHSRENISIPKVKNRQEYYNWLIVLC